MSNDLIKSQAKEIDRLREAIAGWKKWHREISDLLGCQVVERNVTLQAVRLRIGKSQERAVARHIAGLQEELIRLRELASVIDHHGCLTGDCPHQWQDECYRCVFEAVFQALRDYNAG